MTRLLALVAALLFALPVWAQERVAQRHALVIGIDAYVDLIDLETPVADAQAMATTLRELGFVTEVVTDSDTDRRGLLRRIDAFVQSLPEARADDTAEAETGAEVMVFYAGHGVEIQGRNYIVPSDASARPQSSERLIADETIALQDLMARISARHVRVLTVIMDACRDNPFPALRGRSTSLQRGLALEAGPTGSFVLYSALPDQAALDSFALRDRQTNAVLIPDPDPNSVFTRALLPLLRTPGLTLVDIAKELQVAVPNSAHDWWLRHNIGGQPPDQTPDYVDRVRGHMVLVPAIPTASPPGLTATPDPCASALPVWAAIQNNDNVAALEGFAATYAATCPALAALAEERMARFQEQVRSIAIEAMRQTEHPQPDAPAQPILPETAEISADNIEAAGDPQAAVPTALASLAIRIEDTPAVEFTALEGGRIHDARISSDGRWLALSGSRTEHFGGVVQLRRMQDGALLTEISEHLPGTNTLAFSPDGQQLAVARNLVRGGTSLSMHAASNGRLIFEYIGYASAVRAVSFSPDGALLALGLADGRVVLLRAADGAEVTVLRGHQSDIISVAFAPDGMQLVSTSRDRTARLWSPDHGGWNNRATMLSGHNEWVLSGQFSSDGTLAVTEGREGSVRVWDSRNGRQIAKLFNPRGSLLCPSLSPDGRRIATGYSGSAGFVWDIADAKRVGQVLWHSDRVFCARFSPDGNTILTNSFDRTAKLWDARTHEWIKTLQHSNSVKLARFSSDGTRILTAGQNRVRIWDLVSAAAPVPTNLPRAEAELAPLRRDAQTGEPAALFVLANVMWHRHGDEGEEFRQEALTLMERAAKAGHVIAMHNLSYMLRFMGSYDDAIQWARAAVDAGNPSSLASLAEHFERGLGVPEDLRMAARMYLDAVADGWSPPRLAAPVTEEIKRLLRAEGRYSGPIDGAFDIELRRALQAYGRR